jgi:DNA-binding XRE family transcriptional regulator
MRCSRLSRSRILCQVVGNTWSTIFGSQKGWHLEFTTKRKALCMIVTEMSTVEWLKDKEIRAEYGSATLKYDVAAALVAARKMHNLTQTALAHSAGVSQAYIAKLERGEANPTMSRLGAILASIGLKAEINLIPIVSSHELVDYSLPASSSTSSTTRSTPTIPEGPQPYW